jgi:predicted membrane channel-forming protein YqfA (hemolysin III family)
MSWIRRLGDEQPLHLLAIVVSFAIVAAGVAGWFQAGSDPIGIILWALGSAIAFEWILLPLAWLLDRVALGRSWSLGFGGDGATAAVAERASANRAYIRVPALLSALLLIVFAPLIFRADTPAFVAITGISPPDYFARWLLATAAMFAVSAVAYALSLRRERLQRSHT